MADNDKVEATVDRIPANEQEPGSDEPRTNDPVEPGSEQANRDDRGDALRPNNLSLGVPAPDGGPAPVRYPHQVGGMDERAITPENPTDERTEKPVVQNPITANDMRKSAKDDADTRAKNTPGEKR